MLELVVDHVAVEVELARVLGLELPALELNDDVAAQPLAVLLTVPISVVGKSVAAYLIVRAFAADGRFFPDTYVYSRGVTDLTVLRRAARGGGAPTAPPAAA